MGSIPSTVAVEEIPQWSRVSPYIATDSIDNLTPEQELVAMRVEQVLREEGYETPIIQAAIINGLAESNLKPSATSPGKKSFGIFQLHVDGLGHDMTVPEMRDIDTATKRVARAMKRSKPMQDAISRGEDAEALTAAFCIHIMRPKNKMTKAKARARDARELIN